MYIAPKLLHGEGKRSEAIERQKANDEPVKTWSRVTMAFYLRFGALLLLPLP
jgi:hypothetical protein